MSPSPYYQDAAVTLYHGDCREILPQLEAVDHVITDPPYSARTHAGHDATASGHKGFGKDRATRVGLGYAAWSAEDVRAVVPRLCEAARGWVVVFTDHTLVPEVHSAMSAAGRYVFAPLPWFASGSRVRLSGDGPSSWTTWIVVARTSAQSRWGTLPGGYTQQGEQWHMGGKPEALMAAIISDYSRAGDVILDPFAGSGTTAVAAKRLGRRCILIEREKKYCDVAAQRLQQGALGLWEVGATEAAVDPQVGSTPSRPRADRSDLFSEPA